MLRSCHEDIRQGLKCLYNTAVVWEIIITEVVINPYGFASWNTIIRVSPVTVLEAFCLYNKKDHVCQDQKPYQLYHIRETQ